MIRLFGFSINGLLTGLTGSGVSSSMGHKAFHPNLPVPADALTQMVLLDEPESWQQLLARENASAVFASSNGEMVRFPAAA